MASTVTAVVRVGVGVFIHSKKHPGCVLLGKRINSHGHGNLALPGGHLEMNETYQECAKREVKEETNLEIDDIEFVQITQDIKIDGNPDKHYITIFVSGNIKDDSRELINMEPHKCEWLEFTDWNKVVDIQKKEPDTLFDPLLHFITDGHSVPFPKH